MYTARELAALRRCNHPNVVEYLGWFQDHSEGESSLCIVMEYLPHNLKEAARLVPDPRGIIEGIANALVYLHSQGGGFRRCKLTLAYLKAPGFKF